ncbi:Conserved_hypothetical protein [Hexamita inflata]|uniref:Uncharacterized protein n=1 Tax=Hexamita inflata TaxID=28002 RepID=A0AA86RIR9_9EUKA|nr:Conserved hypothetical protein [Hexamita inflata]
MFDIQDYVRNDNAFDANLYCLDNELYFSTKSEIYWYENKNVKLIKNTIQNQDKQNILWQQFENAFNDNLFRFENVHQFQGAVYSFNSQYNGETYIKLFKIVNQCCQKPFEGFLKGNILCATCGVMIVQQSLKYEPQTLKFEDKRNVQNDKYVIIDLLNNKQVEVCQNFDNMLQHLVLGDTGLQFKTEFVQKYFGTKFEQKQTQMYKELIATQMKYSCYADEIRKILPFELVIDRCQKQFNERMNNLTDQKVVQNMQKISNLMNQYIQKQNKLVSSLIYVTLLADQ